MAGIHYLYPARQLASTYKVLRKDVQGKYGAGTWEHMKVNFQHKNSLSKRKISLSDKDCDLLEILATTWEAVWKYLPISISLLNIIFNKSNILPNILYFCLHCLI
jgi:hypothetical protein